jgi:hypothetical protein
MRLQKPTELRRNSQFASKTALNGVNGNIYEGCEHPTALWLEYSSLKASNALTTDETTTLRRELAILKRI